MKNVDKPRDEWIGHFPGQPIPKFKSFGNRLEYQLLPDDALLLPDPVRGQRHICHACGITLLYACRSSSQRSKHMTLLTNKNVDAQWQI